MDYQWDMPFTQPDWWGDYAPGWYQKWGGPGGELENLMQSWWRSPNIGGGIVWHPQWGWQDRASVKNFYQSVPEQVTWQQFTDPNYWSQYGGYSPVQQLGSSWQQYYPNATVDQPGAGGTGMFNQPASAGEPTPLATYTSNYGGGGTGMNDQLPLFGYTGPIGVNPYEQMGLNFIQEMYGGRAPFQTMAPAQQYLTELTQGAYAPTGQKFQEEVYGATKTKAMDLLGEMQKGLAEKFTHRGGFFGGTHAMAQSDLARGVGQDLNEILANLNLSGYQSDIANRTAAASGLTTLGGTQQGVANQILQNIMGGGEMLTSREMVNRSEYQNALERAYNDWIRARQEELMPFQLASSLLGQQAITPIASQNQPFSWGNLLGGLAQGAGTFGGALAGKGA